MLFAVCRGRCINSVVPYSIFVHLSDGELYHRTLHSSLPSDPGPGDVHRVPCQKGYCWFVKIPFYYYYFILCIIALVWANTRDCIIGPTSGGSKQAHIAPFVRCTIYLPSHPMWVMCHHIIAPLFEFHDAFVKIIRGFELTDHICLLFLGSPPAIDNGAAVVIIMCFLLTSSTSFEHMLNSSEVYLDSRTGLPCTPINGTRLTDLVPEWNSSTTAATIVRDYDEIAFGLEQMQLVPEARNAGHPFDVEDSIYCIKVGFDSICPES